MNLNHHLNYNHIIHDSSSSSSSSSSSLGFLSPPNNLHPSHPTFPIIAVAIIGIFATIFLLVFYYIFVIKCCLNWHRIDILPRFSLSRSRNHHHHHHLHLHHPPPSPEPQGLHESVIRSIPIFQFQKQKDSGQCAVCLAEFQHEEKLRIIPNCSHVFHIDCIDIWLQNNPNCPLCRNSISVSLQTHFPAPEVNPFPPQTLDFSGGDQDFVVIELDSGGGSRSTTGGGGGGENSGEPGVISSSPAKKLRKKNGNLSSMGDECINVHRKGDYLFSIQPIRRSFSMDSASDRQLYSAVQEVIQRNATKNNVDVIEASDAGADSGAGGGGGRLRRGFFSFGHARSSAVLPIHVKP